jgi:predicted RNase H-like HicB family nuclease
MGEGISCRHASRPSDHVAVNDGSFLEDVLSTPYIVAVESRVHDGEWVRQASHPELPGCLVFAATLEAALEQLDTARVGYLVGAFQRGESIPRPRPALPAPHRAWATDPEATSLAATTNSEDIDDYR